MREETDSLHPLVSRSLYWFSSNRSKNSTGDASNTDWHITDWFHNNTFDYEEFHEDVTDVTNGLQDNLHPASDVDVNGVLTSTVFNAIVFVVLMIVYEILRRYFPYVYATRQSHSAGLESKRDVHDKNDSAGTRASTTQDLPNLYESSAPLEWVMPVFGISWRQVREAGGLDAYFFLRYIRMCFRITSVSAFWGMLILFPIFANGNNGASGWYHFSMANVAQGSSFGIWVPTVFMYLFSAFVFFIMKSEYKHYVELRLDFLGKGDGSQDPQHHYSLMVEQVPPELRSEKALYDYFEKMFPGRVYSTNMILNLPELEALSTKKLRTARRLEKSLAFFEATGKRSTHVVGRPRVMFCGIELSPFEGFTLCKKEPIVDFEGDPKIGRGTRVDSISYYTHQLKCLNRQMFLIQKNKRDIAEHGNSSIRADSWFTRVSEYAELFMDDPNLEDSDDDNSLGPCFFGTESRKRFKDTSDIIDHTNVKSRQNSLVMESDFTNADYLGMGNRQGRDEYSENNRTHIANINSPKVENTNSPSNMYGSMGETTNNSHGSGSKKRRHFFKKLRRKHNVSKSMDETADLDRSSKEEPLIDTNEDEVRRQLDFEPSLRNRGTGALTATDNDVNQTICIGDAKTTKKVSKVAGRFGLDFGAYAMKVLHRIMFKTLDDEQTNVLSRTGFVTFIDLSSVTCVASAPLTHKPNTLEVSVAPEARDILWQNCHYTTDLRKRREANASNFLALGALLWSIPLAFIQGVSSAENVAQLPGMEWILDYDNGNLALFINAYLPVVALLGLIMLLPIIFDWVARSYEKRKTQSDVQRSLVGRYFYYQLANIYISVTAGSLWKSAADIIARPSSGLEILGNSLPTVVGYFISLIITKILAGLPMVILRLGALSRYLLLRLITREQFLTQRELDQVYRAEPCLYGWEYPTQLLVIVICFTYACISPFILIFGALYFIGALMVYKKQVLYVYTPSYESGGSLFPLVCDRTIVGLICGQLTFMGYSIIRGGHYQPLALVPLVYFSVWTMSYFQTTYAEPSKRLTLERAKELDDYFARIERSSSPAEQRNIPKNRFAADHYKQPVLTEKRSLPLFYRSGQEDPLTVHIRNELNSGDRTTMWYSTRGNAEGDIIV
eukprot:CAMPEP_0176502360 /NCGR_PEP_ID=MMETSP0200_2-20121128/14707_1 /TAXON_ID=947934 /ORGANISM="Chaetoceros sp., Strain GSL56" /LENGTH=1124 /DNA_ID=CAMNT_0017901417 /DNA_START=137 /DNA_END=3511 /DNA_ORIENTATION=+